MRARGRARGKFNLVLIRENRGEEAIIRPGESAGHRITSLQIEAGVAISYPTYAISKEKVQRSERDAKPRQSRETTPKKKK